MRSRRSILILVLAGLVGAPLIARGAQAPERDEELERHLEDIRRQVEDPKIDIVHRERLVMEMAATLDRDGEARGTLDARRSRWTEAIALLDRFRAQNPGHSRAHELEFQAAVYLWARGRSWKQQSELDPTNQPAWEEAIKDLDGVCARLRAVQQTLEPRAEELLDQNVRYRLAQALADRAELDAEGSKERQNREDEALKVLERPITEPTLRGYGLLLQAELLGRRGLYDRGLEAVEAAARAKPPVPLVDVLAARVELLEGQRRFEQAIKAIDSSPLDAATKDLLAVRALLTERANQASGPARAAAESALFRRIRAVRARATPESRLALLELARRVIEPDGNQEPEAWEAMAEGAMALGQVSRASHLEVRAAARADALGSPEQAAAIRLRAGAYLYQAEKYMEADALLTQVVENPKAGPSRAGAGMLRALARGRALALNLPEASRKAYLDALEAQIRDFPNDPATNEARWLLGRLRLAESERDLALALWAAITPAAPRWVDARLAIARLNQEELDTLRINNDRRRVDARYEAARTFLDRSLAQVRGAADESALELALARLELTPIVGHPDEARSLCERIIHSASRPEQRDRARRLHLIALAELNRFLEAEKEARDESSRTRTSDLLEAARLLDHIASETEKDLLMRRFGLIVQTLLGNALERSEGLREDELAELKLRLCRALLFRGDDQGARRALTAWNGQAPEDDEGYLKDLADTYFRLQAYALAIDVERLRLKRLPTGSLPWFQARYRLALGEYHSGKSRDALHLIDATAILHPDLGGGELRDKFIRLRQKIGPDQ